jgi:hypothetical protein
MHVKAEDCVSTPSCECTEDCTVKSEAIAPLPLNVSRSCGILMIRDVRQGFCVSNGSVVQWFEVR